MLSESAIIIICAMSVGMVGSCLFNLRRSRCVRCVFCYGMCVCEQQPLTVDIMKADNTVDPSIEVLKYLQQKKNDVESSSDNNIRENRGFGFDTRFSKDDILYLKKISEKMGLVSNGSDEKWKKKKIRHTTRCSDGDDDGDDYFEILASYSLPHSRTCSPKYSFNESVKSFRSNNF
jgi:hypothetical protein